MIKTQLVATIKRGAYGLWFVRMTGSGYPIDYVLSNVGKARELLIALVEDGFEIVDPGHYCELYDIWPDEPVSQYEDSLDAAELPGGYAGSTPGDNGRGLIDDELVF